jgi:hypothetical protein
MSGPNPYEELGVSENASFEEIQAAKQRLSQQHRDNSQTLEKIEAAYDAIIMDRLRMRQEGKIKVPDRIRFAERISEAPSNPSPLAANSSPTWLQRLLDRPSLLEILWPTALFSVLAAIAVWVPPEDVTLLSLLMALGSFSSVYLLNRKERRFGRSVLLTLIGFLVGIGLGYGLANWLEIANSPIALSAEQVASLVTFIFFWLISSFLR